jgi:hypothetical protein
LPSFAKLLKGKDLAFFIDLGPRNANWGATRRVSAQQEATLRR